MVQREGAALLLQFLRSNCTHCNCSRGNPMVPGGGGEAVPDDGEADPRREWGWRYGEPTSLHVSPPQLTAEVGWLLSLLLAILRMGTLHINTFSVNATPEKTEVSFKQWYHKVWCIKDYYPEAVVWESIIWLLKGAVADMDRYNGPTTTIDHILHKMSVIFGTVVSFHVVMPYFTRWARGIKKRFLPFPQGWWGPSTKFSSSAMGRWRT